MVWQCGKTDMKFVMNQPNTVRPADHMLPGPVINEIKCVQPGQANAELTVVAEHDAPDCDITAAFFPVDLTFFGRYTLSSHQS